MLASLLVLCAPSVAAAGWWGGDGDSCAAGDASCAGVVTADPELPPLPAQPEPRLALLWATPVRYSSLPAVEAVELNAKLARTILGGVDLFRKARGATLARGSGKNGLNEALFAHQRAKHDGGSMWEPLLYSKEVERLRQHMAQNALAYLDALGRSRGWTVEKLAEKIFLWASVHEGCSAHMPHVHETSAVSGVYYVAVPAGSGALVLEDSRGVRAPFGNRVIHPPRAGELIVFPPWLVHHVQSTCTHGGGGGGGRGTARISISFNVRGDWGTTADSSIEMPMES